MQSIISLHIPYDIFFIATRTHYMYTKYFEWFLFVTTVALPFNDTDSTSSSLSKSNKCHQINDQMCFKNSLLSILFNKTIFNINSTTKPISTAETFHLLHKHFEETFNSVLFEYTQKSTSYFVRTYRDQIISLYILMIFFILDLLLFECYQYYSQR